MSTKDLVAELKAHIKELTTERDELNKTVAMKDGRIKQLLLKIEDANLEVQATVKKMQECKDQTHEAEAEVEKMKKKIKQIKHNLGSQLDNDEIESEATLDKETSI
jgi:chromosome segregation ATPase